MYFFLFLSFLSSFFTVLSFFRSAWLSFFLSFCLSFFFLKLKKKLIELFSSSGGRSKPVPPPRSHSLETFGKKFDEFETRDIDIEAHDIDVDIDKEEEHDVKVSCSETPSSQIYETFGKFLQFCLILFNYGMSVKL